MGDLFRLGDRGVERHVLPLRRYSEDVPGHPGRRGRTPHIREEPGLSLLPNTSHLPDDTANRARPACSPGAHLDGDGGCVFALSLYHLAVAAQLLPRGTRLPEQAALRL